MGLARARSVLQVRRNSIRGFEILPGALISDRKVKLCRVHVQKGSLRWLPHSSTTARALRTRVETWLADSLFFRFHSGAPWLVTRKTGGHKCIQYKNIMKRHDSVTEISRAVLNVSKDAH
jgi:hypothetical protein